MIKKFRMLALMGVLMVLLCSGTMAAKHIEAGIYNLIVENGVTVTPRKEDGSLISKTEAEINGTSVTDFYAGAVKLEVSYSGAVEGCQYLVFCLNDTAGVPTERNITYINQAMAESSGVVFTLYPSELAPGKNYGVYLSSNAGSGITDFTQVASFQYYAPYVLGDVNEDGKINATDATQILRYYNKLLPNALVDANGNDIPSRIQAADVNADGKINATDATQILRYYNSLKPNALENQ